MNPVALREVRQMTRSRIVAGGTSLALLGQFLVAAFVAARAVRYGLVGPPTAATATWGATAELARAAGGAGGLVFFATGAALAAALCVALPLFAFGRLVAETPKGRATLELATDLPTAALVDGKAQAALALALALLLGSLPFQLFGVVLGGADAFTVLGFDAALGLGCAVALHFALAVGAARNRTAAARWGIVIALPVLAVPLLAPVPRVLFHAAHYAAPTGTPHASGPARAWIAWGTAIAAALSLCAFLRARAARSLAPETSDRERAPRRLLLALWTGWGTAAAFDAAFTGSTTPLGVWGTFFLAAVLLHLADAAGSPDGLSRRILAERPDGHLRLLLRFPLSAGFPGGAALCLPLLAVTGVAAGATLDGNDPALFLGLCVGVAYAAAALLLARGTLDRLARAGRIRADRVRHAPETALLGVFLVQIPPTLGTISAHGAAFLGGRFPFHLFSLLQFIGDGDTANLTTHLLFAAAFLVFGLFLCAPEFDAARLSWFSPPPLTPPNQQTT